MLHPVVRRSIYSCAPDLRDIPYSGLFSRRLYFANFTKAQPILENKNLERQLMWEEAWFSISIREITFREQELNWLQLSLDYPNPDHPNPRLSGQ